MEEKNLTKEKKRRNRPDLEKFGQELVKPGDNARYVGHALACWNLPPLNLDDDAAVAERIQWFFKHCIEDDMKPTVMGLANALGVSRQTLYDWSKGRRRGEKSDRALRQGLSAVSDPSGKEPLYRLRHGMGCQ